MARGADLKHRRGGRVDDHTGTTSSLALPFIWKATKNKKMRKQADMIKLNRGRKENGGNNRRRWQLQRIEPGSSALEQAERISLLWWNTNQRLDLCLRSPHHHSIFRSFIHIFFLYPPINFAGVIGKPAQPATFTHTHTHRVDVTLCPPPSDFDAIYRTDSTFLTQWKHSTVEEGRSPLISFFCGRCVL